MKTSHHVRPLASTRAGQALLSAVVFATTAIVAPPVAGATSAEPKTHTLFMGADISVEKNHDFLTVKDVSGESFVVDARGHPLLIPMGKGGVSMRVNLALKLTDISATVAGLKADRAYTPANDPYKKFAAQHPGGAGMATSDLAYGRVDAAILTQQMQGVGATAAAHAGVQTTGGSGGDIAGAMSNWNNVLNQQNTSDLNSDGYFAGRLQEELAKKLFDAIDVEFGLSSDRRLEKPYLVVIAAYRAADDKPDMTRNWIYARELDPIDRQTTRIKVLQGGFPPGYELKSFQVHLYDHGQEVATNVAPKRVPLTSEEAFEYVLIEYLSAHKSATLPASPAMGKLPADLPARLARGDFAQSFYVRVSKDGQAIETYRDAACSQQVQDPYVDSLVKEIRFKPALDKGKPVDGVAELNLHELSISS